MGLFLFYSIFYFLFLFYFIILFIYCFFFRGGGVKKHSVFHSNSSINLRLTEGCCSKKDMESMQLLGKNSTHNLRIDA